MTSLYDPVDNAYDPRDIREFSVELGHVPIIDVNRRTGKAAPMKPDRARRYRNRSSAERVNSRLRDDCGGQMGASEGSAEGAYTSHLRGAGALRGRAVRTFALISARNASKNGNQ